MKGFVTISIGIIFLMGLVACDNNVAEDKSYSFISDTDTIHRKIVEYINLEGGENSNDISRNRWRKV